VGVAFPVPPATATVTLRDWEVVMLLANGVTVRVGTINAVYPAVTVVFPVTVSVQTAAETEVQPVQAEKGLPLGAVPLALRTMVFPDATVSVNGVVSLAIAFDPCTETPTVTPLDGFAEFTVSV